MTPVRVKHNKESEYYDIAKTFVNNKMFILKNVYSL